MCQPLNALVVDDDDGIRLVVGDALRTAGHRPLAAASREEALEVARLHPVHFSIVDVHVRTDDGLRILGSLRQLIHPLPGIFMSGAFTPELVARARELGVRHYLEKPLDVRSLLEAVETLILEEL